MEHGDYQQPRPIQADIARRVAHDCRLGKNVATEGQALECRRKHRRRAVACARLPVIVVRFFNTVGPRQSERYGMVIPNFVRQALAGEPLIVHGTGSQTRSLPGWETSCGPFWR